MLYVFKKTEEYKVKSTELREKNVSESETERWVQSNLLNIFAFRIIETL